jgi:hypothetical protein
VPNKSLTTEQVLTLLARAATETGAGRVLERTVLFYARWLAGHERPHVKQVERIVNTMHL